MRRLPTWPALFVPPLVFLTLLSLNYAMESPSCEYQMRWPMHVTAAIALAIALGGVALAWRGWQGVGGGLAGDSPDAEERRRFTAVMALMLSSLSSLAIVMLWVVQIIMPPCIR